MEALSSCRFNKGQTAAMLGMSRSTLWRKMKEYHIEG
ncbi:MAG: helix-turn-helix domain-containing protein [Enterocloster aldenensis]